MTSALTTAAPRLRKLVLMLSSDQDGEVVGAARAIGRVLKDAGTDWHCFADCIVPQPKSERVTADWRTMARACQSQSEYLKPREHDFIHNIALARCEPSDKQLKWLRDIYRRLEGER